MNLYLYLLNEVVQFQTVSFDPKYYPEITRCVKWYSKLFKKYGFHIRIIKGYDNPIILSEFTFNKTLPTVLIYGHYDVQPAAMEEGWKSDPFKINEKNDRLYARGVIDNKGQHLVHLATVLSLIKEKKLGYNVKFFIEGNEETGSPKIAKFFRDFKKELTVDFILISDGEQIAGHPNITAGYRGITNCTVTLKTATTDLHSGIYGGVAPNAAIELCKLLSQIYDKNFKILIPGFYNEIEKIPTKLQKLNELIPFSIRNFKSITGTKTVFLPKKVNYYTKVSLQPTVEISGISSGYTGLGFKSIIPGRAKAKINFRLVKNQNPQKILSSFKKFLEKIAPKYVSLKFEFPGGSEGSVSAVRYDIDNIYVQKAMILLKSIYGKSVLITHHGATLPMVSSLDQILKKPIVDVPLVNEDCNMHGANENYEIANLNKALKFSRAFLKK